MNKSYKSVWNESTGSWVAVSELATGRSKSKRAKTAISKAILTQIAVGGMSLAGASVAMADDTVKQGTNATVNIADGVAIGVDSLVDADTRNPGNIGGIAIGDTAYAMGSGVAVGQNSQAGSNSLAFGSAAVAQNGGTAIGANSYTINNGGVAIGEGATATGAGAMAIGMNSNASAPGSLALGQDSVATDMNTVSVGNATTQRQIANLAAGTHATDAVNVGQLTAAGLIVDSNGVAKNSFVAYDSTAKTGVTLGNGTVGAQIHQVVAGTAATDAVNIKQLTDAGLIVNSSGAVQNGFVAYDAGSAKALVTLGGSAGTTISNVKAGSAAMDAVNVKQLTDAGLVVNSSGVVQNGFVSYDAGSAQALITLKGASGTKISNLANGVVNSGSKDAVNGSQLFNVAQSAATAVGGSSVVNADGTISKPSYKIGSTTYDNIGSALTAAAATGSGGGTDPLAVHYDTAAQGMVTLGNGTTAVRVTNVATGTAATDAVNVAQLNTATNGLNGAVGILKYIAASPNSTGSQAFASGVDAFAVGGSSFAMGDGALAFGTNARAQGVNAVAVGTGSTATKDNTFSIGNVGSERRLVNVAIGTGTTDAVNLGQVKKLISDAGTTVSNGGVLKAGASNGLTDIPVPTSSLAPEYLIASGPTDKGGDIQATGKDALAIGLSTHATADAAVAIGSGSLATAKNALAVGVSAISNASGAAAVGYNASAVSTGALAIGNFATVNMNSDSAVAIGDTTTVTGLGGIAVGNNTTAIGTNAVAIGTNASATGVGSMVLGNNSIVDLTKTTASDTVVIGNSNSVSGVGTVVLGSSVKNAIGNNSVVLGNGSDGSQNNVVSVGAKGSERKIVNVAVGTTATDAVNLGQLSAAIAAIPSGGASPETVLYDTSAHDKLTFNKSGAPTTLSNVAAGVTANDAVNGGQLTAAGLLVDSTGKATNAFVAYDSTSKDTVTLKGTSGTKITALTKGTLSAASTDAVNGSQLFNTASSTAAAIGGGATLDPSTGTISKPAVTVGGTTFDNLAGAITAAGTTAANALAGSVDAVKYDSAAHTKVTLGGTGAPVTLTNVAAGTTTNDAVNVGQLTAMGLLIDSTGKAQNAFVAYDSVTSKDTITLKGTSGTRISNMANGVVNSGSKDAVNGSQLFNAVSSTVAALGAGATVDPTTGTVTTPKFKVGDTSYDTVQGALAAVGTGTGTVSPETVLYDTSAHDKLTFGGTAATKPTTLSNVAAGVTSNDAVNVGQLTAMGLVIDSTGKAQNAFVAYDSVTSKDTITLKGTSGTKITALTKGTLSAASTDAVNGSQLFNTASSTAAAIGGGATLDPSTGTISKPAVTVGGTTFDNLAGAITAAGTTAANALAGSVDAVKYDTAAHDKVTLGGTGAPVTLTNVAAGTTATDAVNVAQFKAGIDSITTANLNLTTAVKYISFGPSIATFANASGTDSIALGGNSFATTDRALAIGLNARAGFADSVALGTNSVVSAANTVSVGSIGAERRIMNVAVGTKTTDAVNLGQVTAMLKGLTPSQSQQVLQSPVAMSVLGATAQNWTDVLATGDSDKLGQTKAVGTDAMAIGLSAQATAAESTAIGTNALATAKGSVAIGNGAISNGAQATAIGVNASVTGEHALSAGFTAIGDGADSIAFGTDAYVGGASSVAIGKEAVVTKAAAGSFLLGNATTVTGSNTFVLGSNIDEVSGTNSVVLGSGSDGSQSNVVSVGGKGTERKIVNVAAGTTTTDAVNLGQLNTAIATVSGGGSTLITQPIAGTGDLLVGAAVAGTHVNFANSAGVARELTGVSAGTTSTSAVNLSQLQPVVAAIGGGAKIDPTTGAVTGPTYTIGTTPYNNAGDAFKAVDGSLTTLNGQVAAITADTGKGLVVQDASTGNITVGALTNGGVVDVTGTAGTRKITGITAGDVNSSSFDAINGSQLAATSQSIATAIGGGSMMNTDGTIMQPSFTVGTGTYHNVGDAITGLDGRINTTNQDLASLTTTVQNISVSGGVATPNAVAYDTDAHDKLTLASTDGGTTTLSGLKDGNVASGSTDAVTGNQLFDLKTQVANIEETGTTVIGVKGADGTNGINGADGVAGSNGTAASASGSDAIAMGDNASASGDHAVVIGGGASGTADGVIAIGGNSNASGKDSIAIGNNATAPNANSVALGANSTTDRDNSVSIGSEGQERQLTNVAAGTKGTDAVNLNQMNQAVGGIARKAYSGIAAATALTMIPDVDANKTLSLGIGGGTFQGYAATAIGGTARITQNIKVRVGAGWSAAGTTVGAGASYQW